MRKRAILLAVFLFFATACSKHNEHENFPTENGSKTDGEIIYTVSPAPEPVEADPVKTILENMTIDEKIGQLFILSMRNLDATNAALEINENIENAVKTYKPGGVILFAENIKTISQTTKLIDELQKLSEIPLFVAVDEEGGTVSRITKSSAMHATVFPGNSEIGKTGNPDIARQVASAIAREIASLGFNMNFAPVADVNTNPDNPVIGPRAYGNDPEEVSSMVAAAVNGIQGRSVSAVLKHFPGHGDTGTDTHYGTAVVSHTRERLFSTELLPFIAGIREGADGIMTAHILTPNIPGENVPATLKAEILTKILRNELGFEGLIITDALNMKAITSHYTADEAAVKAFLAGADILLMPEDPELAFSGIKKAYADGLITLDRLNESVERILKVKYKRGLFSEQNREDPEEVLGCNEHTELAERVRNFGN
ncbi:glycoside hydrolase family 3 [Thermoclostridium stercorarium subsp. leptospartum DSM 9219]|uniref:beta-N-acetylhexosaminidase n=1 Tax=Thermoclostridium stercorarium subsp. leptospartum DSM 9219 TaxID=1346611 RepID=A0A1B1YKH9_THEST|nr:glycoside hydrolase family 3 protein [Thermoclostridium stercorarium]ANX01222.1 glycoside hydrolase family 3 [Thermoclostridium stercorarium subsp. leptospartum DSM 9219]